MDISQIALALKLSISNTELERKNAAQYISEVK